jgi:hypothetical protein
LSSAPSAEPSAVPSFSPSELSSLVPSDEPTNSPSATPSIIPSAVVPEEVVSSPAPVGDVVCSDGFNGWFGGVCSPVYITTVQSIAPVACRMCRSIGKAEFGSELYPQVDLHQSLRCPLPYQAHIGCAFSGPQFPPVGCTFNGSHCLSIGCTFSSSKRWSSWRTQLVVSPMQLA